MGAELSRADRTSAHGGDWDGHAPIAKLEPASGSSKSTLAHSRHKQIRTLS